MISNSLINRYPESTSPNKMFCQKDVRNENNEVSTTIFTRNTRLVLRDLNETSKFLEF